MTDISPLIDEWYTAKQNAEQWALKEVELRKQIFAEAFPDPDVGANKVKLPHGMALVGTYRLNYRIDQAALEESKFLIPPETFEAVVHYRPEIRDGKFRALTDDERLLFTPFLTISAGTPGLEIKSAKKVRW
jgi:hypothetical protein